MGRRGSEACVSVKASVESGVLRFGGQVPKAEGESKDSVLEVR